MKQSYNIGMKQTINNARYMLIDGNALVHRGFHAMPQLTSRKGVHTGGVYGFTMILLRAIKDLKPTHIACTFDLAAPTFRHQMYADYKATRAETAPELIAQFPIVKDVVKGLNIPIFEVSGFEADDCLGTLAKQICRTEGGVAHVMIVTGDMDTLQLVDACVHVYTLRKGLTEVAVYDEAAVRERFSLEPNQMVDYKALRGDPSDNIPGVKGVGEKTAIELIKQFGSIKNLYDTLEAHNYAHTEIKPRVLELLKVGKRSAFDSYDLATIRTDVPLEGSIPLYEFTPAHLKAITPLFAELEFKSLLSKLPTTYVPAARGLDLGGIDEVKILEKKNNENQQYELVTDNSQVSAMLAVLRKNDVLALDTETTGLNVHISKLVGLSLCASAGKAYYIPANVVLDNKDLREFISEHKKVVGHNTKFDSQVLQYAGIKLQPPYFDTMIASYLLNAGSRQHSLDVAVFNEFGYEMQPITELIGTGRQQITMDQVSVDKVAWYAAEDADFTFRLYQRLQPKIEAEKLHELLFDLEMPLIPVLSVMEVAGIKVDVQKLEALQQEAEKEIYSLEKQIFALVGREFNVNSPKQLKEILFDELKLTSIGGKRTKTGASTAAGELEKMVDQHPLVPLILQYREVAKLQSTYISALPKLVNPTTGRIHTNYNQTIAATGRLSSTDPNLQNIPASDHGLAAEIRKSFVASQGNTLLSLDYSQIELRIVAHLSDDEAMQAIFKSGADIHTKTAVEMFRVAPTEVSKDQRRAAKAINFGILYGLSAYGLAYGVQGLGQADAKKYIDAYFAAFPKVRIYLDRIKEEVRATGRLRNEIGRMRLFPDISSSMYVVRQAAERAAVNFPIQSLEADIVKMGMLDVHHELQTLGENADECSMILQVHDELVFEVKQGTELQYAQKIKPLMEKAFELSVPIEVEAKVGLAWGDMKPLKI
jgi:DNA polymerase I